MCRVRWSRRVRNTIRRFRGRSGHRQGRRDPCAVETVAAAIGVYGARILWDERADARWTNRVRLLTSTHGARARSGSCARCVDEFASDLSCSGDRRRMLSWRNSSRPRFTLILRLIVVAIIALVTLVVRKNWRCAFRSDLSPNNQEVDGTFPSEYS